MNPKDEKTIRRAMAESGTRFIAVLALAVCSACAGHHFEKYRGIPDDRQPIPEPDEVSINIAADLIDKTFAKQIEQSFDLSRQLRNLTGRRKRAFNVDPLGEVPNSSWYTNRNAASRMSIAEIATGPNQGAEPMATGTWEIFRVKVEGVTPGFFVEDDRGIRWVIKFEPLNSPELNSAAEVISTKLFHAAGYHVPENYLVVFDPKILSIGAGVTIDSDGGERPMVARDVTEQLDRVQQLPDGRIRVVASKFLPGTPIGPFRYEGTRDDDPNDFIPHEHRRELRGLRIIAGWLNHFDTKANNTLDVYLGEGNYIRHYLIDFGSTLGSKGKEPMPPEVGHENSFDPHQILASTLTLGLHVRGWEKAPEQIYPSIGYFESRLFKSHKYQFIIPNPAFENMTDEDAYWGARIVMSFTDEQLEAVVAEGRYSNPEAAAYLLRIIKERRDIVGRYWFTKLTPLDRFAVRDPGDGHRLYFDDLAVESGLFQAQDTRYRYEMTAPDPDGRAAGMQSGTQRDIKLPAPATLVPGAYHEIALQARRGRDGAWSKAVRVTIGLQEGATGYKIVAIARD